METKTMDTHDPWCWNITEACERALALANEEPGYRVEFTFNETPVYAVPGETVDTVYTRWDREREARHQAWINSEEYKERERKEAEELAAARSAHMTETATTERDMREAKVPWPYTPEQLIEYIQSLVQRTHDYGTAVYAASMAATAAFNYVCKVEGLSGFQASCADLDFIRRSRHIDGPFMLIKGEDALYPQYDLHEKLNEAITEWKPWLSEQASKNLSNKSAHPDVIAHWKRLAIA